MRLPMIVALFWAASAAADTRILLPDGSGCWQNEVGFVYGCSGGARAAPAAERSPEPKCKWLTKKEWESCERKKDWPGQPSNCDHLLPPC